MKGIGYREDPFERKEDLTRAEYALQNSKIMYKNQPFSQVVKQHGTFIPHKMTYGTTKEFPEKPAASKFIPKYGPFKAGDLNHTGHNKTFGGVYNKTKGYGHNSTEYNYEE